MDWTLFWTILGQIAIVVLVARVLTLVWVLFGPTQRSTQRRTEHIL